MIGFHRNRTFHPGFHVESTPLWDRPSSQPHVDTSHQKPHVDTTRTSNPTPTHASPWKHANLRQWWCRYSWADAPPLLAPPPQKKRTTTHQSFVRFAVWHLSRVLCTRTGRRAYSYLVGPLFCLVLNDLVPVCSETAWWSKTNRLSFTNLHSNALPPYKVFVSFQTLVADDQRNQASRTTSGETHTTHGHCGSKRQGQNKRGVWMVGPWFVCTRTAVGRETVCVPFSFMVGKRQP